MLPVQPLPGARRWCGVPRIRASLERGDAPPQRHRSHWDCAACTFRNAPGDAACAVCQARAPAVGASDAVESGAPGAAAAEGGASVLSRGHAPSESDGAPPPRGNWTCTQCTYQNAPGDDACAVCQARAPVVGAVGAVASGAPDAAAPSAAAAGGGPSVCGGAPARGHWTCAQCTYQNAPEDEACIVCRARAPAGGASDAAVQRVAQDRAPGAAAVEGGARRERPNTWTVAVRPVFDASVTRHPDYEARWAAANVPWSEEEGEALVRYAVAAGGSAVLGGGGVEWTAIVQRQSGGAPVGAASAATAAIAPEIQIQIQIQNILVPDRAAAAAATRDGAPTRFALLRRFNELLVRRYVVGRARSDDV
jgi:hypothetical protein